jgi:sRNA-binding carbon storage regulator CsrA
MMVKDRAIDNEITYLEITRKVGQSFVVGDDIFVSFSGIDGNNAEFTAFFKKNNEFKKYNSRVDKEVDVEGIFKIKVKQAMGKQIKIAIKADKKLTVLRKELYDKR